ncbi:MAG: sugar phosphate isomerase/epimerase family protein [Planctomycetota bacterium]|jgi:sugar phosphate isomerase/epimerase
MAQIPVALQLYTVRDQLAADYVGTLKRVKEIGYDLVQLTGQVPFDAPQMRDVLDEVGLSVAGIHVGLDKLQAELGHWIAYCKTLGTPDLVCPYLPEQHRGTQEDWLAVAALLDGVGARCADQGVRLSYHNHSFEFVKFDGKFALDLLYENTSPEHLYAEIDTYWVQHGGADPVEYIRKYSGRLPILHIKDMSADESRTFAEIGMGILDWPAIHQAAVEAGVEFYCVEQDTCPGDPFDSARISWEFMRELLKG